MVEMTRVELRQPQQAIATKVFREFWWDVIQHLSSLMAWASSFDLKGDVRCPSTPWNSTEHWCFTLRE